MPALGRHDHATARRRRPSQAAERPARPQTSEMQGGGSCGTEHLQRSSAPFTSPLTYTRSLAVQALGLEIVEVILKMPLGVHTKIAQKPPGVDAGVVHIVESNPHRIIADRIDGENRHITLSANRLALRLGMTLHFGRGARDTEQFGGESEDLAV